MGTVLSCRIANNNSKTIWVKYDVEKKYVKMEEYTIEGQVGVAGIELSAGASTSKTYNWDEIGTKFTPVCPGDFIEPSIDRKDGKVMFVTIIREDDFIICNSLPIKHKNLVVTKDAQLRKADKKRPFKMHKKYDGIHMSMSRESHRRIQEARDNKAGKPNEISFQKVDSKSKSKSNEELKQQVSEAQEKLTSKASECNSLKQKLEMAEKQLSDQSKTSRQSQQHIRLLEKRLADKDKQTSSLTVEREHMVDREHELEASKGKLNIELESKVDVTEHENVLKELHELQEKNKDLQQKIDVYMNSADERTTEKPGCCITNLCTEKLEPITIKSKDDEEDCNISRMAVTNTGTILLADRDNENIKSVSSDNKVLSVLSLPSEPLAITVLDTTTAVAAADNKKLYIVNISEYNTLSLRDDPQLEYFIVAMVSYNGNIVATCYTEPWTIQLITIKGEMLWSVAVDLSISELFAWPDGITRTTIKGRAVVVVSDSIKNTLTVLEADLGKGKEPSGITVDNDGNVYVCYTSTSEIVVWSNDFKESKILLSGDKLGECPSCIVYSAVDDSLYVSYDPVSHSRNTVDRFRLV